jgi:ABC-type uncharacterized transport system fused permease/ATPase subunit
MWSCSSSPTHRRLLPLDKPVELPPTEQLQVHYRLDVERFRLEADFRYALLRLQEHAESIAFYRGPSLLHKPRLVLLDEATSAMDSLQEEELYQELLSLDLALVSVAHRPSLTRFHSQTLELSRQNGSPATKPQ